MALKINHLACHSVILAGWVWLLGPATVLLAAEAPGWQAGEGYRSRELRLPATGRTFLERLPPASTGIAFTNFVSEQKSLENSLLTSGSGVAAGDVDGDGWCDLYFCGMESRNTLYRNLGNWRFEDVTASAGVACEGQYSIGAVFADVDGDGDLDLLVTSLGGGTRLFLNDGKGHFAESTNSGLLRRFGSTTMALADIDGNGTLDLYVANYATTKIEDRPNAKFDSKTIDGKIVLTAIDGVSTASPELTNRYFVDAQKIVRERGEPDILYLNDGHGKFKQVSWTDGSFLDEDGKPLTLPPYEFGLSAMFRDMDGDGAPDLYVCNDLFSPDRIWTNDGRGHFRALSNLAVRETCRFSMGIDFADINRDGFDDFLVVDMLSRDAQRQKVQTVGVPTLFLPIGQINDRPQYRRNTLFLNRGDGTYAEIAQLSGLEASEWTWMPVFLDVDLDGFEDVLMTTGYHRDSLNADSVAKILAVRRQRKLSDAEQRALKKQFYPPLHLPNQAFRNRGDLTFEDAARQWGFDYFGMSHGLCLADLDNDGDLDVIVNTMNDAAGIYRNETVAPRVAVRLKGKAPNTRGIGAKIKFLGGPVPQSQEMICGGRYLSGDDNERVFAAGSLSNRFTIEVTWRSGSRSVVRDARPNYLYEVDESGAQESPRRGAGATGSLVGQASRLPLGRPAPGSPNATDAPAPLFRDVSALIQHAHTEEWFDDFERQPLLSRKLSQLGPGVSWYDVDGDGWEDLIIGTGKGGRLAIYLNDSHGGFKRWEGLPTSQSVSRDLTAILGWRDADGQTVLLAGSSNYEDGLATGSCVRQFNLGKRVVEETLPGSQTATGPLAMADIDGDGTLDLFVGGRVIPGQYPEPGASLLFRGAQGRFVLDEDNSKKLSRVGLVSAAIFSDLNGDGFPELILACEWGPVKIFRNDHGRFTPWNPPVTFSTNFPGASLPGTQGLKPGNLSQLTGWWNGVAVGDFDGDGRLDIVASNWGRNSKYQSYREQPCRIFYGQWRAPGLGDSMEAFYDSRSKRLVPWCSFAVARALPWIAERVETQEAFGAASVSDLLKDQQGAARMLSANWLETTIFFNRGDRFEARILPVEAQFSPAFGISVGDLDGDGNEDIFLSQNFFAVDGDTSRYDAGRGLWLAGDGRGNFRSVPGQESGIKVYGEQRGCALCDYDADGRLDLVVTQNGAETKLYHNEGAKPGLRVRLIGPAGNPLAVGATLRMQFGSKQGPMREIHAGSGYWSQESAVQVFGTPQLPTQIQVRWPGGQTSTNEVPRGAKEISIDMARQVKVVR